MFKLPKNKKLQALIIIVFLIGYTLFSHLAISLYKSGKVSDRRSQSFVAAAVLSKETKVESRVVASKLDFQRKLIRPTNASASARITAIIEENGGEIIESGADLIVAYVPKETENKINQALEQSNTTEVIEVDYPTFLSADNTPWGVKRIEADKVWETTSASGIKIAVIDTGIDYNHPDLKSRYFGGYDTVNEDNDPMDDHGHGTHVSGIISSDLDDQGIAGVAPKGSIVAIKALSADGSGYISDLVDAIDWAINNGVQVINYSLGSTYNSKALEDKINEAAARGVLQVAAAGNNNGGSLLYPAAYGAVISVSATDSNDNLASFSALGAELAAPGVSINSTVPGGYASWSGTSMAAPHVSATIALMMANNQPDIRKSLQNTALDLGPAGVDSYFGYGLVQSKPATLGEDALSPVVTFLSPADGAIVNKLVQIRLEIQDEASVSGAVLLIDNKIAKEWSEEPYEFEWNTENLAEGSYELLGRATDDSENEGQAKITVSVSNNPSTSPTPKTSRAPFEQGRSGEVRQDVNQLPAQENRQNYENMPSSPGSNSQAPDSSNINERNQKPELPEQAQGRGVRGASDYSLLGNIIQTIISIFR